MGIKFRRQFTIKKSSEFLIKKFQADSKNNSDTLCEQIVDNHILLKVLSKNRHYWSPEMNITIDENEDGNSFVREVIGPGPAIFTLTMFLLLFGGVLLLFTIMFLFSQISLGLPTDTTWLLIILSLIILASGLIMMYVGRRNAKDQMECLREYEENIIGKE